MSGATDTELMSGGLRKKERSHQSQVRIFWVLGKKTKLSIKNAQTCILTHCCLLSAVLGEKRGTELTASWTCHGPRQNGLFGRKWGMIFTL